ncbi:MAG: S8 family serine peptidase [Acidiferrobacterales bacterium]
MTVFTSVLLTLVLMLLSVGETSARDDPVVWLRKAVDVACEHPHADLSQMASRMTGVTAIEDKAIEFRDAVIGWRRRFSLPGGAELKLERIAPRRQLRRLSAEYAAPSPQGVRSELLALTGPDCNIRFGRRLIYDGMQPQALALEELDETLAPTGKREALNPPVPTGKDPGGVLVAIVDAGVNYLLPEISARLARDQNGSVLGYDYWDLDDRPFDAHPARSLFFPQRHGTRTAGIVLREAPAARLLPYRYPRPDMTRMAALVEDAAAKGVVIVNLSLGSNRLQEWQTFGEAAKQHPQMLFIVSAGNNGRDIDAHPVYPAALSLENIVTVTSSEVTGELARGSNWGRQSVDLLVPAEKLMTVGFRGDDIRVSGSSYAAARVAALAARLLEKNPEWHAPELKAAIFARTLATINGEPLHSSQGFIPDPSKADLRTVAARETELRAVGRHVLTVDDLYTHGIDDTSYTHSLHPTFAYFDKTAWNSSNLRSATVQAAHLLSQCGIFIPRIVIHQLQGRDVFRYFRNATAKALIAQLPLSKPTVYFVRDTLQRDAYDAEAIGKANSTGRSSLMYTIWMTEEIRDPGIALAHELVHILMDSGEHVELSGNLMQADTSPDNVKLAATQCERIKSTGVQNGLLHPLPTSTPPANPLLQEEGDTS